MMQNPEIHIPSEAQYVKVAGLPQDTRNRSVHLAPTNGGSFVEGGQVMFDIPTSDFMDPTTVYIRYTMRYSQATNPADMFGTPASSPFATCVTQIGSTIAETIPQYGVAYNMLTNLKQDMGMKAAAVHLGYFLEEGNDDPTLVGLNGSILPIGSNVDKHLAFPLLNILTGSSKLIPLFMMPATRITLTIDYLTNFIRSSPAISGVSFYDFELVYDSISFGSEVQSMITDMGPITLKCAAWTSLGNQLPIGSQGSLTLTYNLRYNSIRSIFATHAGQNVAKCFNKGYDSFDVTTNNGSYGFTIGSETFPTKPMSVYVNKMQVLLELKQAISGLHNINSNCMSITAPEFFKTDNSLNLVNGVSTLDEPGKFWVGVNCENFSTAHALLTGVNTLNSTINYNISCATATMQSYNVTLFCLYDALLQIDPTARTCTVLA
jgi:hypothetical protein